MLQESEALPNINGFRLAERMMTKRPLLHSAAIILLSLYSLAVAHDYPSIDEAGITYYTTEVQLTDVLAKTSVYATEYYDDEDDRGSVKVYFQGEKREIYYDNTTFQIIDVKDNTCTVTDEDISDFDYFPIYHGWLNKVPLVIGPSAPLFAAITRREDMVYKDTEFVRNIKCDVFELPVINKLDNLTMKYYFAPEGWTLPYKYDKFRTPIRVRVTGVSSRLTDQKNKYVSVDQISDFAYFRAAIKDFNNLLPPIGLGCQYKKKTDNFPKIPESFKYTAEVVDLLDLAKHKDVEVKTEMVWYDYNKKLARQDSYTRSKGYKSTLYDFNTGVMHTSMGADTCKMEGLRNLEFQIFDYGETLRMMEPKEALYLDGTFYEMGEREIRGIMCDVYESVKFGTHIQFTYYEKLVVTVYFSKSDTAVGVDGVTESRIPIYLIVTGWDGTEKTLQLQYNIYGFDRKVWPEMYSSFRLERCYPKPETKAYFVLMLEASAKSAALMEGQDELIVRELRSLVAKHAKVPEMRIPFLKVDYKPTGVFATGLLVERPPALLQFYKYDEDDIIIHDKFLKLAVDAKTLEQCSFACVDEGNFLCKGFFFCNQACFLKSVDPTDQESGEANHLGFCTEYLRDDIDSTNLRQSYLEDALRNLETAVLNSSVKVEFIIPGGEGVVTVKDVVIGDGPYIGVDAGDKPYTVGVEFRKLDPGLLTTKTARYAVTLHDCYKRCKEAGSECASFSFCPDSPKDDKECMYTSELVMKDLTKDSELKTDKYCNIYDLKFVEYFTAYPEKVTILKGDKVITSMDTLDHCAKECRLEKDFKCRGFEYCKSKKICTLHKKHILDLQPGESGVSASDLCTHYAARYIADFMDMGIVLIDDKSDVRFQTTLEECAKVCSEELSESCLSFNYCPSVDGSTSSCALSSKTLSSDGVTTIEDKKCTHYRKRDGIMDWTKFKGNWTDDTIGNKTKETTKTVIVSTSTEGYTKKGFTGLVIGMLTVGIFGGALAFVLYSYLRSRSGGGEGMAVRFMKSDS